MFKDLQCSMIFEKKSEIKDFFSPSLPCFIAASSATSGTTSKMFAKYRHLPGISYGQLLKFTVTVNDRSVPSGLGYIVEQNRRSRRAPRCEAIG
ncbi:hypothetical protein SERLA73DRAFT_188241 [Serpula lacrymans var. lacrymans S7.3]|uniref:Uncharacterized protein n=2 Tax=Serpula lacrymans var. lacrymans TaxID=341189 RepID=F8QB01_SERL3|nr:uncharacterized protein SERLADRAFT_478282 [Serpula lacrymans var. lacrymans S7.9]EGN94387.1 hypothetical protein SERLA73DRAFT_188241 [Serpula lacrymans var. lacrymans S7.3]EGO19870.1 hypothetical protein SERLADRAFT_478282 [Serpula lacrymans var. lacrymans S7.9]